jgi:GNAT superfamily N-acetyltransferase
VSQTVSPALLTRPFRAEDEASVVDLLGAALGPGPTGGRTAGSFRWKHLDNPFGRSLLLVAEQDGELVGLRAFMRWRFWAGPHLIRAARAVDTATHPDHQGHGIFSRLTREALDLLRDDTDLVFNTPNAKSGPGYLKLGWRPVGRLGMSVRLRRIPRPGALPPRIDAPPAAEVLGDHRVPELLREAETDPARITTKRSLGFLRWRYGDAPLDYRAVTEERGGEIRGVAFLRVRPRGRLWQTSIADVIVRKGDPRTARRLLAGAGRVARADVTACRFPRGSTAARAAASLGFVPIPGGIRFVVNPLREGITPDPAEGRSWALRLGDVEVF